MRETAPKGVRDLLVLLQGAVLATPSAGNFRRPTATLRLRLWRARKIDLEKRLQREQS